MVSLAAPPRIFTVDPRVYEPLTRFTCGNRSQHDRDADRLVKKLCRGETIRMLVRVAKHPWQDDIMAVSASAPIEIVPADFDSSASTVDRFPRDAICIALVGVGAKYHGTTIEGRSLGSYMLRDVLTQGQPGLEAHEIPPFWSTVAIDNTAALDLCRLHGFALRRMGDDHNLAFRRNALAVTS